MNDWLHSLDSVRAEVCRVGKSLFERGLVHATAGNISVRLPDVLGGGYLITPTDACLGFLEPAALSVLSPGGELLAGAAPSKTLALHQAIYAAALANQPQVRCVIHTHSSNCVALSLAQSSRVLKPLDWHELLPPLTAYFVMKVGRVPLMPYAYPGSTDTVAAVTQCIRAYANAGVDLRAMMLERLGPNVWHESPAKAMAVLEELEETAKLQRLTHGESAALNDDQLRELQLQFKLNWLIKIDSKVVNE